MKWAGPTLTVYRVSSEYLKAASMIIEGILDNYTQPEPPYALVFDGREASRIDAVMMSIIAREHGWEWVAYFDDPPPEMIPAAYVGICSRDQMLRIIGHTKKTIASSVGAKDAIAAGFAARKGVLI